MAGDNVMAKEVVHVDWPQLPQRLTWEPGMSGATARSKRKRGSGAGPALAPSSSRAGPTVSRVGSLSGAAVDEMRFEYLEHPADVQIHSWGGTVGEAFAGSVVGMFGYMVSLGEFDTAMEMPVRAEGHDLESLLYAFLDECLYIFHTDSFVMKHVDIIDLNTSNFQVRAIARGGLFDAARNVQGTEVKAITYSNMKIEEGKDRSDVYVIVDI